MTKPTLDQWIQAKESLKEQKIPATYQNVTKEAERIVIQESKNND
jgi:hypothetical protein